MPWRTAQVATALAARYRQIGKNKAANQAARRAEQQALGALARLPAGWNTKQVAALEKELATVFEVSPTNMQHFEKVVKEMSYNESKTIGQLNAELRGLETNLGHFGYVHHYFESEMAPSKGKAFDALGRIPMEWLRTISGTHKMRTGSTANKRNLLTADITQIKKEIRSEAANTWMQKVEDQYGLLVSDYSEKQESIPDGYEKRQKVVANFGMYEGETIYLPNSVVEQYKSVKERRDTTEGSLKEFGHTLGVIEGVTNRINHAMLYHPGKMARDILSQPFHLVEFLRDWSIKHPSEPFHGISFARYWHTVSIHAPAGGATATSG